jgi:hypothetical protein
MEVRLDRLLTHRALDMLSEPEAMVLTDDGPLPPYLAVIKLLPLLSREELIKLIDLIRDHLAGRPLTFKKPPL